MLTSIAIIADTLDQKLKNKTITTIKRYIVEKCY